MRRGRLALLVVGGALVALYLLGANAERPPDRAPAPAAALAVPGDGQGPVTREMDFEACVALVPTVAAQMNVPANRIIPIVSSSAMTVTKIVTDDENILVSCSKPDRKVLITRSSPPDLHLIR